ncbi:nucleoside triphosphate pyrophosphohydrolase family protein [Spirosoma fluviale]|uniref:Uncharacterized protein n=1 Tax=Spirosoma fluviale TaxID=1597977 RepID=A0A286FDL3_9BACT|nr:hypothetical protein [Spirosoma fluviale]SOD81079.1 hypothetical protein SAMN06269250_1667 [Spirosoma fluviale]
MVRSINHIEGTQFCIDHRIAQDLLTNLVRQGYLIEKRSSARYRHYMGAQKLFSDDVALLYLETDYNSVAGPLTTKTQLDAQPVPAISTEPVVLSPASPALPTSTIREVVRAVMSQYKAELPPFNLGEMAEHAFQTAYSKGFYQKPRELAAYLMEVNTEIGEARDAHRNGMRANYSQINFESLMSDAEFEQRYEQYLHKHDGSRVCRDSATDAEPVKAPQHRHSKNYQPYHALQQVAPTAQWKNILNITGCPCSTYRTN